MGLMPVAIASPFIPRLPQENSAGIRDAATAMMRNDVDKARALLASCPESPKKLLVLATLELNEGRPERASDLARRLLLLRPDARDARLLAALARGRLARPREPWRDAMIRSLKEIAADPGEGFVMDDAVSSIRRDGLPKVSDIAGPDGFILRVARRSEISTESLRLEALSYATVEAPFVAQWAALSLLYDKNRIHSDDLEATEARRALLARMVKEHPENVHLRLAAVIDGPDDKPFRMEDLDAAGIALSGKDASLSLGIISTAIETVYERFDPASAWEAAWGDTFGIYPDETRMTFLNRTKATADSQSPEIRKKLALVTEKYGRMLFDQPALIDSGFGISLLALAARISGNEKLAEEAKRLRKEFSDTHEMAGLLDAAERLPMPALRREILQALLTDERGFLGAARR
jgi:hypothetical protein